MGEAREIYLAACARIAEALGEEGFSYTKSKQILRKVAEDLTFELSFQSNRRNFLVPKSGDDGFLHSVVSLGRKVRILPSIAEIAAFGNVGLIAHTLIRSKTIKKWRSSLKQPLRIDDVVTVSQIGNLKEKPHWNEFNLANAATRERTMEEIIKLIRTVALPYHKRFQKPEQVISDLLEGKIPWLWEQTALDYVACFGTHTQAQALLQRYLAQQPDQIPEFWDKYQEHKTVGARPFALDARRAGRLAQSAFSLDLKPGD
jgi:hypothetical protein